MTSTIQTPSVQEEKNLFNIISWTALLVGILDITAAMVKFYIDTEQGPIPIFKYIASGVFGKQAFSGGTLMTVWGAVFHFLISFLFTTVFFLLYPRIVGVIKNKFVAGTLYGIVIWATMNLVVLPLSNTPPKPFEIKEAVVQMLILICMVGIPIALMAHMYSGGRKRYMEVSRIRQTSQNATT
jgi:magnesium-transporting ATPase (P-type)